MSLKFTPYETITKRTAYSFDIENKHYLITPDSPKRNSYQIIRSNALYPNHTGLTLDQARTIANRMVYFARVQALSGLTPGQTTQVGRATVTLSPDGVTFLAATTTNEHLVTTNFKLTLEFCYPN